MEENIKEAAEKVPIDVVKSLTEIDLKILQEKKNRCDHDLTHIKNQSFILLFHYTTNE